MAREEISEILVNRPGEIWIERAGAAALERLAAPDIDDLLLKRLAEQVARVTYQGINRERPILSASLPGGARIQMIGPPAVRHWCLAIRQHRLCELTLDDYKDHGPPRARDLERRQDEDVITQLRRAVKARATILISGGTSSGKTTFLNALLREIPESERVILVEDTPELHLHHENGLGLVAVKGELGEAKITTDDLLQAALRLRPDRMVLGEIRGAEAVTFLRVINTGHPGSFTTIHANSPEAALEQLALVVMQTGLGLSRADTLSYARSVIDVVVQLERRGGKRGISEVMFL
nr:P-type DNA transfer ATPase VirB11 [Rhizomicrobium palustre]